MNTTSGRIADPITLNLEKKSYKAVHPQHGALNIHRQKKRAGANTILFRISLDSNTTCYFLEASINLQNSDHDYMSTFGYNTIELPHPMKNIGASYFINKVLAETAGEVGIDRVVIDNVVSPVLDHACRVMGMVGEKKSGGYSALPKSLVSACEVALIRKGWKDHSDRHPPLGR